MKRAVNVVLSVFLAFLLLLPSVFTVHAAAGITRIYVASDSNVITATGHFRYDADTGSLNSTGSDGDWNIAFDDANNLLTLRNLVIKDTKLLITEETIKMSDVSTDPRTATEAQQSANGKSLYGAIGLRVINYAPLTIDLQGSSSITLSNPGADEKVASNVYGLAIAGEKEGSITIQGSGSLTINCTSTNPAVTNYPFVSAFAVYNTAGEIDVAGGTLDLNAEGTYAGIGMGAYGNDPKLLYSLKMSGGSLSAKGTGDSIENNTLAQQYILGVGTGLSAARAVSVSGGSVNAVGRGANRAFGINLYSGMETSGGDIIADADLLNGYTIDNPYAITAHHYVDAPLPFSPAISINSPMSILEARNASGAAIADPVAFDYDDGTPNTTYVIGPENGASSDLAKYVHLGIPAAAPATAASSWVPSYEVRFLDCSGKLISDQWVAEGQPAEIPQGFTYKEEELSWVYRSLTVSPVSCKYSGYVVPNTADRG